MFMVELVSSYPMMRESGYEVVDKTLIIKDLLKHRGVSSLYLRPRRFGKTLAVSTIDSFLNRKYRSEDLFHGTEIMDCPEMSEHMNAYPVIRLDLKGISDSSKEDAISSLRDIVSDQVSLFPELLESDRLDESDIMKLDRIRFCTCDDALLHRSMLLLSKALHIHYDSHVVILIDEYDAVMNSTCMKPWYGDIVTLMRNFLSATLKSNDHVLFAFVTGVTDIGRESIFSCLNNMYVNDITSDDRPERFGLTEEEVRMWCRLKSKDVSMSEEEIFREIVAWYDGYTFGDTRVFNPWSVVNYLSRMKARPYWVNSGSVDVINLR